MLSGQLIAKGTTADVYAWGEGRIIKLFHLGQSRDRVEYEAHIGRTVAAAGLPVPQIFEVIEHEGRWGIVCERVPASDMLMTMRPWNARQRGREMAQLHTTLFSRHIADLPRQRERLTQRVSTAPHLTEIERRHVLDVLNTLPDGDALCHGDFHPLNLMRGQVIIDWTDATQGHPTADIARTILIIEELMSMFDVITPDMLTGEGTSVPAPMWLKRLFAWGLFYMVGRFLLGYRQEIERLVPDAKALIPRWMPVLAAARLHEGQYTVSASSQTPQADQRRIDRMVGIARRGV